MNARFMWAGKGKDIGPHYAFSNPANYREIGPIVSWDFSTSTVNHSATASVTVPVDSSITPAQAEYGNATVNAGDHVFLQDQDNPTGYGGVAFIHGTVDKVDYRDNMMTVHFRNPMSYLANNNIKKKGVPRSFDSSYMVQRAPWYRNTRPFIVGNNVPWNERWIYYGNYVGDPIGWKPASIINHLVLEFARADIGGPFMGVRLDPSSSSDGAYMFPNFETANNVSLLNAILQLAESTRWSDNTGWGHEVLANIAQSGAGFSTELFIFRRGFFSFPNRFVYGDAAPGEFSIMDYSFPEQTFDVPTGATIGTGGNSLDEEGAAIAIQEFNSGVFDKVLALINRGDVTSSGGNREAFKSSGRATNPNIPYLTNKESLVDSIMGKMTGIGTNRGPRVGSIKVPGWVSNTLFPGFLATVDIPQAGINNQSFIVDEVSYSEPEGITTIKFNRQAGDTIQDQISELIRREEVLTSQANSCIDTGWVKADGNVSGEGAWDHVPEFNAPEKLPGDRVSVTFPGAKYDNNYLFSFKHQLGSIPSRVRFEVGYKDGNSIHVDSIVEIPKDTWDADIQANFGYVNVENSPFHWRAVFTRYFAYNFTLDRWYDRQDPNVYIRCRVYQ